MSREAYMLVNGGVYYATEYPSQKRICYSKNFTRALRKARKLGYDVRVYTKEGSVVVHKAIKSRST